MNDEILAQELTDWRDRAELLIGLLNDVEMMSDRIDQKGIVAYVNSLALTDTDLIAGLDMTKKQATDMVVSMQRLVAFANAAPGTPTDGADLRTVAHGVARSIRRR